jgi:hypothetical protein
MRTGHRRAVPIWACVRYGPVVAGSQGAPSNSRRSTTSGFIRCLRAAATSSAPTSPPPSGAAATAGGPGRWPRCGCSTTPPAWSPAVPTATGPHAAGPRPRPRVAGPAWPRLPATSHGGGDLKPAGRHGGWDDRRRVTAVPLAISRRQLGSSGGEGWAESAPGPHQGRHDASLPLLPQAADLLARRRSPAPMGTSAGHRQPALQPGSEQRLSNLPDD